MKVYTLVSDEELAALFRFQERQRNNFELGDTVKRLLEFFTASRAKDGNRGGDAGRGCQGEDNAPEAKA